jgi:hypothetical protein
MARENVRAESTGQEQGGLPAQAGETQISTRELSDGRRGLIFLFPNRLVISFRAMISPRIHKMLCVALMACMAGFAVAGEPEWKPLWNGKDLTGWHPIGKGEWKIEGDQIVGRHDRAEKEYSHLVTDAVYGDFEVRFKFKSVAGNSGLYFRIDEDPKAFSGVRGFQAEIDPKVDVGGLYETNGRSWVVKPTGEQVASWFKPGEWNEMTVSANGPRVKVTINGKTTAEIDDPQGRKQGRFALQVHGGQECLVYFKDLEIKGEPVRK